MKGAQFKTEYEISITPISVDKFEVNGAYAYILQNMAAIETAQKVLMSVILEAKGNDIDENFNIQRFKAKRNKY